MSKKRLAVFVLMLIAAVVSNYLVWTKILPDQQMQPNLVMKLKCDKEQLYQIYYSASQYDSSKSAFHEEDSSTVGYSAKGKTKTITLPFAQDANYIRIDLGAVEATHEIEEVAIQCKSESIQIDLANFIIQDDNVKTQNMIQDLSVKDGVTTIKTHSEKNESGEKVCDPYVVIDVSDCAQNYGGSFFEFVMSAQEKQLLYNKIILCVAIDVLLFAAFLFVNRFSALPMEVYHNRRLVMNLAKNDFKTKYAGSYLGIIWAFVQPVVTVAVYSFVFQVGFRSGAVMDCPFVLWLVAGMVPWFFFSDALNGGTASMIEYSYLVKKVVFKISILPIVKIISALFVHAFFVFITILLFALFGYYPNLYTLQVVYYSFCMFVFVLGLTYATCAIIIFFRDLGQIIGIFLQVGVWLTPIMWQETMMPERIRWILKINPIYYIVNGYRESLIDKRWFWENPNQLVYFWFVTAIVFVVGSVVFKRLKVHFADVL